MKKSLIITFLIFNCFIINFQLTAQPTIQWQKSLGGSNIETANSILQTLDGGYIVAGGTKSNDGDVSVNKGGTDCWVVKLDVNGIIQWEKTYGGSGDDAINTISQTLDGVYILAAGTFSSDGDITNSYGNGDYWIVKIDSVGNIVWEKSYGGSSVDIAGDIKSTSDGGYIVVGYTESNDGLVTINKGGSDYWIIKIDSIGNLEWEKSYGGSNGEKAYSIQQTQDLGYIVVGESTSVDGDVTSNNGGRDYWVVKLDSIGNLVWQKNYGGSGFDRGKSIISLSNGGYVVGGVSNSTDGDVTGHHGIAPDDYWLINIDSIGNLVWEKSIGGTMGEGFERIKTTVDGGSIIIGTAASNDGDVSANNGSGDYWVVKIDSLGNIEWEKNLGGSSADFGYAIDQTTDNGFIVCGGSSSIDGDVTGNHGINDFWVVKLNAVVGVEELGNSKELLLYPNPTTNEFKIDFKYQKGVIEVYDMLGQKIISVVAKKGNNKILVNNIKIGTYIVKIKSEEGIFTGKLMIK